MAELFAARGWACVIGPWVAPDSAPATNLELYGAAVDALASHRLDGYLSIKLSTIGYDDGMLADMEWLSPAAGAGLLRVLRRPPVAASNTYAQPALLTPSSGESPSRPKPPRPFRVVSGLSGPTIRIMSCCSVSNTGTQASPPQERQPVVLPRS